MFLCFICPSLLQALTLCQYPSGWISATPHVSGFQQIPVSSQCQLLRTPQPIPAVPRDVLPRRLVAVCYNLTKEKTSSFRSDRMIKEKCCRRCEPHARSKPERLPELPPSLEIDHSVASGLGMFSFWLNSNKGRQDAGGERHEERP